MEEEKVYCKTCLNKEPSVQTVLEVGVNITANRFARKDFICKGCLVERNHRYKGDRYAEYKEQLHIETVEELTQQWEDPHLKHIKEIADRVYKTWNKYGRRLPLKGIRRDWICEVIFSDYWFIDANGIVEDYLKDLNIPTSVKRSIKSHLVRFVASREEHERLFFQIKARNRWDGIVNTICNKYKGKEKIVATPKHQDPTTKEFSANWYLLSSEDERIIRESAALARIESIERSIDDEKAIVLRREELEKRQKVNQGEQKGDDNKQ